MNIFGKKKTRGVSDNDPVSSVTNQASSVVPVAASFSPLTAFQYEAPQPEVRESRSVDVNFFAGGNENKEGEQQIGDVEVGNSSNGVVVSPMFANNRGKFDIKIGNNNVNGSGNQKIGEVKFGNVIG